MVWPTIDQLEAKLGVPLRDPADTADAQQALDAAIGMVERHSSAYHTNGQTVDVTVERGTLDLAVALYTRRKSFDELPVQLQSHYQQLLGMGRYAYPQIAGGT